jgi:molybdate transport system substrate-binding protein
MLRLVAALILLPGTVTATRAAEIKVLTAGAMKTVVLAMLPAFEAATGHKVTIDSDTAGGLSRRIGGGEAFDVAVVTPAAIDQLIASGHVATGSRIDLAKVGMGVAVKDGAPIPDITTTNALKRALLAAKSIAYIDPKAGGSSGIYFDKLIERLGIAEPVRAKARLLPGGYVAEVVAKGEVELAVHQISEIVPVKGVTLVGPLPSEVQNTTVYSGGIGAAARDAVAAKALLAYFAGPEATAVLKSRGMEKP